MVVNVRIKLCLSKINLNLIELLSQVTSDKQSMTHPDEDEFADNGIVNRSTSDESSSEVREETDSNTSEVYDQIDFDLIKKMDNYRMLKRLNS